jgi:L-asparaginase II
MLAFTRQIGAPADNYHKLENPIQQRILEAIEQFSGVSREEILIGIDGCSLPNFALPLTAIARMSARLVSPPADFDTETRVACRRVVAAMMTHPQMISGTGDDTLDTFVMESAAGRIVSKVGAEGVYTASVLPNPQWKRGLGIALKIENGEDRRSRPIAALEILRQLGVFDAETAESLNSVIRPPLKNRRQIIVGEVAPVFELKIES